MKTLIVLVVPIFLLCGCGVKEGAEFYALQKQHDALNGTVSNLQVQVEELVVENRSLQQIVSTNALAISLLIEDQKQSEINLKKLEEQIHKIQEETKK